MESIRDKHNGAASRCGGMETNSCGIEARCNRNRSCGAFSAVPNWRIELSPGRALNTIACCETKKLVTKQSSWGQRSRLASKDRSRSGSQLPKKWFLKTRDP